MPLQEIARYSGDFDINEGRRKLIFMTTSELNPEFEALLHYIKHNRGFDFTGYKRSTLMRRVQKRMQLNQIKSYTEYMDYLEVHPDELVQFFNTILINVTCFFRDRSTWDYIGSEIIPQIAARKGANESIRVWSVGCASGQEAYTLAIVLAETLGLEKFLEQVKIYATELDEEAINQARRGIYTIQEIKDIPEELRERYFEQFEQHYSFHKNLRRNVIFGRHNLTVDAPISQVDLLVCRNTLMYFNAEAQGKIIARFLFALNEGGFLFLGKAEMLVAYTDNFTPIDLKRRIFTKVPKTNVRDRSLPILNKVNSLDSNELLQDATFNSNPVAQILVDLNRILTSANEQAQTLFSLHYRDLGRPLQDLEVSYRPVNLRSCIDQVYAEQSSVTLEDVEWIKVPGKTQYFNVQVLPILDNNGSLLGASITFIEITRTKQLRDELEQSNQELEMAYEELQSTNEELETTNEELQASNEELQATNEELETMNEEIQSSNEELQTMNEELRQRSDEAKESNALLETILMGLRSAVIFINRELYIQIWNNSATDLWGLQADEVEGQHFLNLDIGLPVEQLRQPIRACLLGAPSKKLSLAAINCRGQAIQCQVTCTALISEKEVKGVLLLMEQDLSS